MACVDIVIPLGMEGMGWNDNELRYALRSIEKNFKDLGQVWIIGYQPSWLVNVKYVRALDPYRHNKDANLINKILLACTQDELSENFLFTSDDHFIMKPVSAEWFEKPLMDNRQAKFDRNKKLNRWQQRLARTEDACLARSCPSNCYEAHIPYMFNKKLYPHHMLQFDYGEGIGYTLASPYYNSIKPKFRLPEENTVARVNHKVKSRQELDDLVNDKMFFNYSTHAFDDIIKTFLTERFTEKSKFEA
tara:strand:+ start:373 stop:1113 length:741 start_codon:yes stop_codon:yes gene_type:complete